MATKTRSQDSQHVLYHRAVQQKKIESMANQQLIQWGNFDIKSSVSYVRSPSDNTIRSTYKSFKFCSSTTFGANSSIVNVDELNEDEDEEGKRLHIYHIRLHKLMNMGSFLGLLHYEESLKSFVVDPCGICLPDILNHFSGQTQTLREMFFTWRPIVQKFKFSEIFCKMLRGVIIGIQIILSELMDYPALSADTIVFLESDTDFTDPKLLDIYPSADYPKDYDPKQVWHALGTVVLHVVEYCGVRDELCWDVEHFLNTLMVDQGVDNVSLNLTRRLTTHPSLMDPEEKKNRISHMRDHCPEALMTGTETAFRETVCGNINNSWITKSKTNTHLKCMHRKKNKYDFTLASCIRFTRNTYEHLNDNFVKGKANFPKHEVEDVEELIQSVFPKLMCFLFERLVSILILVYNVI